MRKQSITVRCDGDGCERYGEVEDLAQTPVGWYQVRQAGEDLKLHRQGFDFHSLRCVEKWAKARRIATEGNGASKTPREPEIREAVKLALETGESFTSPELQSLLGLNQGTVDKYLRTWTDRGILTYDSSMVPRRYLAGEKVAEL